MFFFEFIFLILHNNGEESGKMKRNMGREETVSGRTLVWALKDLSICISFKELRLVCA